MTIEELLIELLDKQKLQEEDLKILRTRRSEVETDLRNVFGAKATIKYGGSKAKGTMIQESYDLDIVCYLNSDVTETLEEIYEKAVSSLEKNYIIEKKKSAVRILRTKDSRDDVSYHVDVVPGKYVDESKGDCYLHQNEGDKQRLKTNLDIHIDTIKDSELTDIIKLAKLWKVRWNLEFKTFVLEIFVVKYVDKKGTLKDKIKQFFEKLDNEILSCKLFDPANGSNEVSGLLSDYEKSEIKNKSKDCLNKISTDDLDGWHEVFCEPIELNEEDLEKSSQVVLADQSHAQAPPWPIMTTPSSVSISASVYKDIGNNKKVFLSALSSNATALPKHLWIQFVANTDLKPPYYVYWQIVNTGHDAIIDKGLRGGFEAGEHSKWEYTRYAGKHYVLCYIVKGDQRITSKPFFVNISSKIYTPKKNRFAFTR